MLFLIGFLFGAAGVWYVSSANVKNIKANSFVVKRQTLTETLSLSGKVDAEEFVF